MLRGHCVSNSPSGKWSFLPRQFLNKPLPQVCRNFISDEYSNTMAAQKNAAESWKRFRQLSSLDGRRGSLARA
jgi:hypothetical protein